MEDRSTDGMGDRAADGMEDRAADGMEDRAADGIEDRAADGMEDRAADGIEDRAADGIEDRAADGMEDRAADGTTDRSADGTADGSADGTADGSADGLPLRLPYGREPMSEVLRRRLDAAFPVYAAEGLAPFGPTGLLLPSDARPFLERYYNTPVDPGDVWIVTLPKCGETMHSAKPMFVFLLRVSVTHLSSIRTGCFRKNDVHKVQQFRKPIS